MEKVKEEYNCAEMYLCPRCEGEGSSDGWYCDNCNPKHEIDFDIEEDGKNLKGIEVCPYCYNQLVDKLHSSQSRRRK